MQATLWWKNRKRLHGGRFDAKLHSALTHRNHSNCRFIVFCIWFYDSQKRQVGETNDTQTHKLSHLAAYYSATKYTWTSNFTTTTAADDLMWPERFLPLDTSTRPRFQTSPVHSRTIPTSHYAVEWISAMIDSLLALLLIYRCARAFA